jgi:hypothetical protein
MRALIYTLTAIWVLGLLFAIGRLWYFQIQMFNNFAPGVNPYKVKGGFFDSRPYNPIGQKAQQRMLRFYWKVVTWGLGWPILIGVVGSLVS